MRYALAIAASLIVIAPIAGQAPSSDDVRQAVGYVDVRPSATDEAIAAFRRYRDAVAQEAGFVGFDLVEQIGRRGHFVAIDVWRDQVAYDAHQAEASLARLQEALQPLRTSGYDRRPYRALSVGSSRPSGSEAIYVVTHVDIGGGAKVDAAGMLRALAAASRAEPGCLRFDVTQHAMRANHFTIVEAWENERALEGHAAAPHTRKFRDDVQPATGSPLDERIYRRVE